MLFEVDSTARVPAPPIPKSPQTSSGVSDRKALRSCGAVRPSEEKIVNRGVTLSFARPIESSKLMATQRQVADPMIQAGRLNPASNPA